jgi:hypothetical protein
MSGGWQAGQLPIDIGGPHGSAEVVRLLRQEVAPPSPSRHRETGGDVLSAPGEDGYTALPACAAESEHVETVSALCKILSSTSLVEMGGNVHGGDAAETTL